MLSCIVLVVLVQRWSLMCLSVSSCHFLHLCCCCCIDEVLSLHHTSSHRTLCLWQGVFECLWYMWRKYVMWAHGFSEHDFKRTLALFLSLAQMDIHGDQWSQSIYPESFVSHFLLIQWVTCRLCDEAVSCDCFCITPASLFLTHSHLASLRFHCHHVHCTREWTSIGGQNKPFLGKMGHDRYCVCLSVCLTRI